MVDGRHRPGAIFRTGIRVFESLTILFLLNCLVAFLLYVLGNYQDFLDSSQFLLLDVLRVSGALCTLAGLYYLVSLVVWSLRVRRVLVWRMLFSMAAALVGIVATGTTMFLSVLVS
jgi:hypothetical protein